MGNASVADDARPRCLVIAEAGVNHDGDPARARRLVEAAAHAGADVVKFQTFAAERLASGAAPKPRYQRERSGGEESQQALLRRLELDEATHLELRDLAVGLGLEFLSTPYDAESADLLERLGVRRFKIASGELTHLALLRHVAAKGRPVLLSTGMSTLDEVAQALGVLERGGASDVTLLHCTSSYPADPAEANLRAMETMRRRFGLPVGYSDHTPGIEVACAAVALGAVVIEKHFTLDRSLPGPDHAVSLEPDELARLVSALRSVEGALGDGQKRPMPSEGEARALARRGLFAMQSLPAGHRLRAEDLAARRPALGVPAGALEEVVGRRLRVALPRGEGLLWEHLA